MLQGFLQKYDSLLSPERDIIQEQIALNTPIEQILFYIDAPRESNTLRTREDIRKIWLKDESDLRRLGEKDTLTRIQTSAAVVGTFVLLPYLGFSLAGFIHPTQVIKDLSDTFAEIKNWTFSNLNLMPTLTLGGSVFFLLPLYQRYKNQEIMDELMLSKKYEPYSLSSYLKNSPELQKKLDSISPCDQVLLQHLANEKSDERLRIFLTTDDEGREEMLKRYPPTFQQRLDCLFRQYQNTDKVQNTFFKLKSLPDRVLEMFTLQIRTEGNFLNLALERLDARRKKEIAQSPSLAETLKKR